MLSAVKLSLLFIAFSANADPELALRPIDHNVEPVKIRWNLAKMSRTLKNMIEDLGGIEQYSKQENFPAIPVIIDLQTLNAVISSLKAFEEAGQPTRFSVIKKLLENSFTSIKAGPEDIKNFILAVNYLSITNLLRPSVAVLIDRTLGYPAKTKAGIALATVKIKRELNKNLPKELHPYFNDYINWLANPASLIIPTATLSGSTDANFIVSGDRLYAAENKYYISVIDIRTNEVIGSPIKVGLNPCALAESGNKLYVANGCDFTISVIDTKLDKVIGLPIAVGRFPFALVVSGNKLYVANNGDGTISVIDVRTDELIDSIAVGGNPTALTISGNKLYVANSGAGTISVIDIRTNELIDSIAVGGNPIGMVLSVYGTKLYVANFNDKMISIIDTETDRVIGLPISLEKNPRQLTISEDKLYVGFIKSGFKIFDLTKFIYKSE